MLGRTIKIFISSILHRRPRIFKEFFYAWQNNRNIYFFQFCKEDPVYLKEFFAWQNNENIYILKFAWQNKKNIFFLNLQRRPRIFKEFFMLCRRIFFFFQFCKDPVYLKIFFAWYNNKDNNFFKSGKKTKDFLKIFFVVGRIILQRRPSIFKEIFCLEE